MPPCATCPPVIRRTRGFTLVELVVVVVVLGVLAAFAVPRFLSLEREARVAAVESLAGALRSTAYQVRALCMTTPGCPTGSASWQGTLGGRQYWLNYGWPDAGDELNGRQVDALVEYAGFRASIVGNPSVRFVRDDAPDPLRCSVQYFDAWHTPPTMRVVTVTDGC